jgi:hypothetical protein
MDSDRSFCSTKPVTVPSSFQEFSCLYVILKVQIMQSASLTCSTSTLHSLASSHHQGQSTAYFNMQNYWTYGYISRLGRRPTWLGTSGAWLIGSTYISLLSVSCAALCLCLRRTFSKQLDRFLTGNVVAQLVIILNAWILIVTSDSREHARTGDCHWCTWILGCTKNTRESAFAWNEITSLPKFKRNSQLFRHIHALENISTTNKLYITPFLWRPFPTSFCHRKLQYLPLKNHTAIFMNAEHKPPFSTTVMKKVMETLTLSLRQRESSGQNFVQTFPRNTLKEH